MKSPLRLLVAAGPILSLGLCLTTLLLWLRSYEAYPAAGFASGSRTWHAGARRGEVWLTCTSGWPTAADAGRAARTAAAARPLLVASARFDFVERAQRDLAAHAAFLRRRLGAADPEAAGEERLARSLRPRLHDELARQAGGPSAEPVIADRPPEVHARWDFRSERAWARFPMREDGGAIVYGPRVTLAAIAVPCWAPAALMAAWPAGLVAGALGRRFRARRRARAGRCLACGYDLRATGDVAGPRLDRCPECGTPALAASVAAVTLVLLLAAVPAAAEDGATTAPAELPGDPAVRALVLANERARDRLPPFAAVLAVTVNQSVQPEYADRFDLTYRAKGTARYLDGKPDTGPRGMRTRVVLNDAYVAAWGEASGAAYQNEYEPAPPSIDPQDNRIAAHVGRALLRHDPLLYAYGDGQDPLRQALANQSVIRYAVGDATDAAGRNVVRLTVYTRQIPGPTYAAFVYEFDPQRGHAITRVTSSGVGGQPRQEHLVELQPAGDGWIPKRIRTISHDYNSSTPRTALDTEVRLTAVGDVPDTAFRLDALELPESAMVIRTSPSGFTQGLVRHDGVWVPMSPAWLPVRTTTGTTLPAQRPLPKWTWPAALTGAGAIWVLGVVLMRRRLRRS